VREGSDGPRGTRALPLGGWAPSRRTTPAARLTGTGPLDPSRTPAHPRAHRLSLRLSFRTSKQPSYVSFVPGRLALRLSL